MKAASNACKAGKVKNCVHDKTFTPRGAAAASHNISQAEAEEAPPAEEHDQDGDESPSEASDEGVGEPTGDLEY